METSRKRLRARESQRVLSPVCDCWGFVIGNHIRVVFATGQAPLLSGGIMARVAQLMPVKPIEEACGVARSRGTQFGPGSALRGAS